MEASLPFMKLRMNFLSGGDWAEQNSVDRVREQGRFCRCIIACHAVAQDLDLSVADLFVAQSVPSLALLFVESAPFRLHDIVVSFGHGATNGTQHVLSRQVQLAVTKHVRRDQARLERLEHSPDVRGGLHAIRFEHDLHRRRSLLAVHRCDVPLG